MAEIANRLGVGRSTLYRWVGDRDALMDQVVDYTTQRIAKSVNRRLRGKGLDRVASYLRAYLDAMTRSEPLQSLVEREPYLALQVFMDPDGVLATHLRAGLRQQLDENVPYGVDDTMVAVLSEMGRALVWAGLAGGYEPRVDDVVLVLRTVVTAHAA